MDGSNLTREELLAHIASLNRELLALRERLSAAQAESGWVEDSLKARTRVLNERVKELACILETLSAVRDPGLAFEDKIARVLRAIPAALQRPADAWARFAAKGWELESERYAPTPWSLSEPVVARGREIGRLEAGYRTPASGGAEPFLREERELLRVLADCLGLLCELRER